MTLRLLLAVAVVAVALGVAGVLRRRRPDPPTRASAPVPAQLDRADFAHPDAPWLVALFSSTRCDSCAAMAEKVAALASDDVAVEEIEYTADPERHARYGIEAVPVVVVADRRGVTRASFVGPAPASGLWSTLAALRSDESVGGSGRA